MKKKIITFLFVLTGLQLYAQDLSYARKMLDTLTSKAFWGRGYTNKGMEKAADFIVQQLKEAGLTGMAGNSFEQTFFMPINTFPGKMDVSINGKKLKPGVDFIIGPESTGIKGSAALEKKDSVTYISPALKTAVVLKDKLTWSPLQTFKDETRVILNSKAFEEIPSRIDISVEHVFEPKFTTRNICAVVKGTRYPDSIVMLTAHYDHLGGMGKDTYFPGANDNASGVSFLLSMARYYAEHPQPYTVGFIFFAAEEAGLVGSEYFTDHPLVDLKQIKFLINLDLVGTGEDGMTVVNASVYPQQFTLLNQINDEQKLMKKINSRGKAANSDHYFFTEHGVPAFFMYTQGGVTAYHDVYDIAKTLPFTRYNELFKLVTAFIGRIQQ